MIDQVKKNSFLWFCLNKPFQFSTHFKFDNTGSLWILLGIWCCWITIRSFLHPLWHGNWILWFKLVIYIWTENIDLLCCSNIITLVLLLQNISLSANDLVACCGWMCGDGCDGGYPIDAWRYFVQSGVVTEEVLVSGFSYYLDPWYFSS